MTAAWARALRARLVRERGGACERCGARKELEWHHLRRNGLRSRGRGSDKRAVDVRDHPRDYALLCRRCHELAEYAEGWQ